MILAGGPHCLVSALGQTSSCLSEVGLTVKDFQKPTQERRVDIKIPGLVCHGSNQWRKIRHGLVATMTRILDSTLSACICV